MVRLYYILSFLISPLIPLVLKMRELKGKEEPGRMRERLGYASIPRPNGALLWFHAASMGEAASIVPVLKQLCERYPDIHILLTTVTVTSAKNIAPRLPSRAFHQFVPVDTPQAMGRFLKHWKPDMAFWVESEFWPNMILGTQKTGCPMYLLNARVSRRSSERWYRLRSLIQPMLDAFVLILAKSDTDASRLKNLGAERVDVKGNLKFSAPALEADPKITGEIISKIRSDHSVWVAASTHAGEEEVIAEVHHKLKESYPRLLTVIVPRHAHRGQEIAEMMKGRGLRVAQRSKEEEVETDTDIYVADTMGELGIFYRVSDIVFIGGSLIPHGGQNPFEPARLDCAIIYGPHMDNFLEFCHELESSEGALKIHTGEELAARVDDLLRDHDRQEALAQAAREAVKAKEQVIDEVLAILCPAIEDATGVSAKEEVPAEKKPKPKKSKSLENA